jgi:hypothetical protein
MYRTLVKFLVGNQEFRPSRNMIERGLNSGRSLADYNSPIHGFSRQIRNFKDRGF